MARAIGRHLVAITRDDAGTRVFLKLLSPESPEAEQAIAMGTT